MMPDPNFWKNRRVFLTGHTGFKGSWLSLWLEALGAEVTGYSLAPPTTPSLFEQAQVARSLHSIVADIRDFDRMKKAIGDCRPEVVIHMAAQTVVRRGYVDPIETYSTNVIGTVNLFEAIRRLDLQCAVVNVTSDKCYFNREWVWAYREEDKLGGHDPYSNSKACAELVTSAYRDSFFSPGAHESHGVALGSARAGNVIGGGDWTANQLIPDLMRAFLAKESCLIRNPYATRPWQFVLEPLRGYLLLAEHLQKDPKIFASGWNFGPAEDDARPVSWIADRLVHLWENEASWTRDSAAHPHEANLLKLDASKAKWLLNWRPLLPLDAALDWIVAWYRSFQQQTDLGELTRTQITQYAVLDTK
ncbi:MAG TPA: CDP-glucose 4,6-dehydratase [Terracidiphilus sp.]|jgi:CDP-glucose 4,6-dehydratase